MPRISARRKVKRSSKAKPESKNIPLPEDLLDEAQYGDALAEHFDHLYPESTMVKIQRPFYRMMVKKYNPKSAFDVSCRTGQTLKLLKTLGVSKLSGADVSRKMLRLARRRLPKSCRLMEASIRLPFENLQDETFDFVLCTKDALSLMLDDDALVRFFKDALHHLTANGLLILETLNYEKIWKNKERFLPMMDRSEKSKPRLFTIIHDFHQELLVRNLMKMEKDALEWYWQALSTPIRPITRAEIEFCVQEAGFAKWGFLGGYAGAPFDPLGSYYTVLIAKK